MWLKLILTVAGICIFVCGFFLGHFCGFCMGMEKVGDAKKPPKAS